MSKAHGPLADRPNNPKVGLEIPHESAALHVTGKALYTDDLEVRTRDALHAWPPAVRARRVRNRPGRHACGLCAVAIHRLDGLAAVGSYGLRRSRAEMLRVLPDRRVARAAR